MKIGSWSLYWVIGSLALAMLPQLTQIPLWLTAFLLLPAGFRLLAEQRNWQLRSVILRGLLAFIGLALVILAHGSLVGRLAGATLLTVMLSLKLVETHTVRDARIVVSLCFFLAITQFLFHRSALMLVYALLVAVVGLLALARITRDERLGRAGRDQRRQGALWDGFKRTALLVGMAAPVMLVLFMLFPRLASPLWGLPEYALDAKTGLSDSMAPGSISQLFADDSPAFRVTFDGPMPPVSEQYWRGPVLWNYDGRQWSDLGFYSRMPPARLPPATGADYRYRVQLEPHERRWLFALDYPVERPRRASIGFDFQIRSRRPITELVAYETASDVDFVDSPTLRSSIRDWALQLPDGRNPETDELVLRWRQQYPSDRELIQQVLTHFNQQPFEYTLEPAPLGYHAVDDFLFQTRQGYCEHYASAFTVMMRMAGIPARVVTGYQGGFPSAGGYLLVKQSDAHAWSEVWLPEAGWTRVDPTAAVNPARVNQGALAALEGRRTWYDYPWLRSVRNSLDLIQNRWNEWVLAFNADRQRQLFSGLGIEQVSPALLTGLMLIGVMLVSVLLLPLLRRRTPVSDQALRLYQKYLRLLARTGVQRHRGEGAFQLADRIAGSGHSSHAQLVASAYYRARYDQDETALAQLRQLTEAGLPDSAG